MNTLGTLLLWCVLQVTLVAVATMIAYFLARRGGASLRSSVVLAGLITATLLVPLAWSPWPRWELPRAAENTNEPPVVKEVAVESTSTGPAQPNIETINNLSPSLELEPITWRTTWNNFVEALEDPRSPVSPASPDPGIRWSAIILSLFGAALVVGLARLVGGYWSVRRTIRQARRVRDPQLIEVLDLLRAELSCKTPIELRETHKTATAAASGWRRPVILLPVDWRGWTSEQTRAVLAHELAHVVRRDYLTACVAQILLALHFYHPLWQWLVGRLRLEQELSADALAASVTGGREAYLKNLAALALRRSDASIAWPARAFLPSRHTFLRRVEMLRDPKSTIDRSGLLLKAASVAALFVLGGLISGIRPGAVLAQNVDSDGAIVENQPKSDEAQPKTEKTDEEPTIPIAAYIPPNAYFVVAFRPQGILNDSVIKPHAEEIKELYNDPGNPAFPIIREAGVVPENVDAVAWTLLPQEEGQPQTHSSDAIAIRLSTPVDRSVLQEHATKRSTTFGGIVYEISKGSSMMIPEEHTLLIAGDKAAISAMLLSGKLDSVNSTWAYLDEKLDQPALSLYIFPAGVKGELLEAFDRDHDLATILAPLVPTLDDANSAGIGVRLGEHQDVRGFVACPDKTAAGRVAATLKALITLGQNTVRQFKTETDEQSERDPTFAKSFIPMAEQLLKSATVETDGASVRLHATSEASVILSLALPAVEAAREAALRTRSMNNLKQIALAFHKYHDQHGYFPPAVIEENGVKRSWRVEILPYLDQKDLYEQYRKNEPWDSAHNKKILAQMPDVFRDPADSSKPNSASYYLLTSEHAVANARSANAPGIEPDLLAPPQAQKADPTADFRTLFTDEPINIEEGEQGPGMRDITDGTSNTIMIVEDSRNVPWTKPEDIPIDPDELAELKDELGGNHEGGFLAALGDGSVKFISDLLHPTIFKRMISPVDGHPLSLP